MQLAAGVDSSTQSTKVVLRDVVTGELIASATASHPPVTPPVSEQDPATWWQALVACFDALADHAPQICAISVGAQQHGLVVTDDAGPLRAAKLWNDTTSATHADRLVAEHGAAFWAEACGSVPLAAFTITKLAWVAEHEPAVLSRVQRIMLPHDYLTFRLTGAHVTDRGDASGTGWFDPAADRYRTDLLSTVVDDADAWIDKLPQVLAHDEPAGTVSAAAAAELGLGHEVIVGPGSGDNMAAALGVGLQVGDAAISLGTSGTVYSTSSTPVRDSSGMIAGFADATGNFLPLACTMNATKVTDAAAQWLGVSIGELSDLALAAPAFGPTTPTLLPYLDGERTPNRPEASGWWTGLRVDTSREELARSAFDGVLCGLLDGLDMLASLGAGLDGRLLLLGGGSRSPAYQQRAADLSGHPVVIPHDTELVATGAAAQAAAVLSGTTPADVAQRWALGHGTTIDPASTATPVREAHRALRDETAS